jgi:hypothetical protein
MTTVTTVCHVRSLYAVHSLEGAGGFGSQDPVFAVDLTFPECGTFSSGLTPVKAIGWHDSALANVRCLPCEPEQFEHVVTVPSRCLPSCPPLLRILGSPRHLPCIGQSLLNPFGSRIRRREAGIASPQSRHHRSGCSTSAVVVSDGMIRRTYVNMRRGLPMPTGTCARSSTDRFGVTPLLVVESGVVHRTLRACERLERLEDDIHASLGRFGISR